jgi:peptide deformylase
MAPRDILILPDKTLRLVSKPVAKVDSAVRRLVEDMFETMYAAPGIGLAAIQVGEPKRIVTLDLAKKDEPKNPQVFINPELTWESDERRTQEEGCLSIPEYYEEVESTTDKSVGTVRATHAFPAFLKLAIVNNTAVNRLARSGDCCRICCATRVAIPVAASNLT